MALDFKKVPLTGPLVEKEVRPSRKEINAQAREIAAQYGRRVQYIVVCPEHGATGPYEDENVAQADADMLNQTATPTDCVYRVLPLFNSSALAE